MTTTAHAARSSDAAEWGARAGLVARGLLWFVLALLAGRVAVGGRAAVDKHGALAALREQPLGGALLVLLALAFAAHALFRVVDAAGGHRDEDDDRKRLLKRAGSGLRAIAYGALAVSTVRFLLDSGAGAEDAKTPTAKVMALPAGAWWVGAVGLVVVGVGLVQAVRSLRTDFTDKLTLPPGRWGTTVTVLGAVGRTARALVYALIGGFLVQAAVTFDPGKAKGLDASLKTAADQSYGRGLLVVAAIGMLAFALWSWCEARYRDV